MPNAPGRVAEPATARRRAPDPVRVAALAVGGAGIGAGIVVFLGGVVAGALVVGLVLGIVVSGLVGALAWIGVVRPRLASAEARILDLVGGARLVSEQPNGDVDDARFANLVEGLAPAAGLVRPRCFVVEDPAANALAAGRDPRHGCVVVTTGLLHALSRMELEGVVAQCLVRIRDEVVAAPTVALAFGRGAWMPDLVRRAGGNLASDLAAVALTRYPPGLASALRRLAPAAGAVPARTSALLGPLWLVPPGAPAELEARIEALEEL